MSLFQTSVLDLKEKASSLASSTLKKDNRLKSLEISLEQKKEECVKLENQVKKVRVNDLCYKISLLVCIYFGLKVCEIRDYNSMEIRLCWLHKLFKLDLDLDLHLLKKCSS